MIASWYTYGRKRNRDPLEETHRGRLAPLDAIDRASARNGTGKPRQLDTGPGTISVRRPRVRGLNAWFGFPVDGEDVVTLDDPSAPGTEGEAHLVPGGDVVLAPMGGQLRGKPE